MKSSGKANTKGIDSSAGGLVWVRRPNGSWWPGRIMGLDELSESCLVSTGLGTPVKLLGRQDASIDWYNLEKSKRVKAFRCGEYDDCIEKAKASLANSSEKTVKYARRNDAIIHALELESAHLGKDRLNVSYSMDTSDSVNGIPESREKDEEVMAVDVSDFENSSESSVELSQSVISFEDPNHIGSNKVQSGQVRRRKLPGDSEGEGREGIKRMRGLDDLGMNVMSKKKVQNGGLLELVQQENYSNAENCISNGNPPNGSNIYSSSLKRKRSQVLYVHEFLKRRNRRRPLMKVIESIDMVSVPVTCDELPNSCGRRFGLDSPKKSSPVVINDTDSLESNGVFRENGASLNASDAFQFSPKVKKNETPDISELAEKNSSHRLFDVTFLGDKKLSAGRSHGDALKRQPSRSSKPKTTSLTNKGVNEYCSTSPADNHLPKYISKRIGKGTSKWQLKGKRNSRHISQNRKHDSRKSLDNHESNTSSHNSTSLPQRLLPYRHTCITIHSRCKTPNFTVRKFASGASLYNVKLEVNASYQPQDVSLASLTSKSNGKAIIGHSLTVEVLDDGYCDYTLLSRTRNDMEDNINDYAVKPNLASGRSVANSPSNSPKTKKFRQLSKKIRKLSSPSGHLNKFEDKGKGVEKKLRGPVIACVPLKVVFSRIDEAVNGLARPIYEGL